MDNNNTNTPIKQVTSGTKLESIGTVKTVVGEVKAVDPSGVERTLQPGEKVFPNETIMTAVGALVLIEFMNGTHLDLPSASQIVLDSEVFDPALLGAGAGTGGETLTAEQIQEMIARGEDPTAVTEATAAGAGAGDEGGSSFIVVDFNNTQGEVTSGFNTLGIPGPESTTLTELPPVEEEPVAVPVIVPPVVTVEVDVVVELPPSGGNGGGFTPIISGSNAYLPEGTDGEEAFNQVTFILRLDKAFDQDVTVYYEIRPGTAIAPNDPENADYFPDDGQVLDPVTGYLTGFVVIPAGTTEVPVVVNVVPDHIDENDNTTTLTIGDVSQTLEAESFYIVLTDADNATINPAANTAYGWIVDDDTSPTAVNNTYTVDEDATLVANVIADDNNGESAGGVDNDQDGDSLTVISFTWGEETADADDTITLTGIGALTIESDGTLTFVPDPDYDGEVPDATYTITDGYNDPSTAVVAISINPINDPPVGELPPQENYDSDVISLNVAIVGGFTDADGDTLSYTASGLPNGLTISPEGVISGTIVSNASDATNDNNNVQEYSVTIHVDDGTTVVDVPFTWTVNNTIPEFDDADDVYDFSAPENTPMNTVVGTVTATDADADTNKVYSITGGNGLGLFAINAATGEISVTQNIDDAQLGDYVLTVQVNDLEGGMDTATVNIALTNVNDPPVGELPPQENYDSDAINLNVATLGGFTDADGDTLSYTASGLPDGLTISPEGVISGTIVSNASDATNDNNNVQEYSVTIHVDDGTTVVDVPFTWTVNNTIPEFDDSDDVYDFSAPENTPMNTVVGTVTATDVDADTNKVYSITLGNELGLFAINAATGEISVTQNIDDAQLGDYVLTVQVNDLEGGIDTATVNIALTNVNDPPVGELPPQENYDSDAINLNVATLGGFTDADGDTLSYTASGLPDGLTISPEGVISGTIVSNASDATNDNDNVQEYSVTIHVDDGTTVVDVPFTWTVNNTIPEFDDADDVYDFSAPENTPMNTVVGTVTATDADADTNKVYSITGGNGLGLFAINAATGEISVTQNIDDAQLGDYVLTVQVNDLEGGTDTATVNIALTNVNDPPVLTGDADEDVNESGLSFGSAPSLATRTATGTLVFSDADSGDVLHLFVNGEDKGALDPDAVNASTTVLGTEGGDYGTITFYLDGSWSYELTANVDHDTDPTPSEAFSVKVNDGTVDSATVTLAIDIVDDTPIAAGNTRTMLESTSVDNPIISDFSDSDQFLHAGKFFSAGSGNVAVQINGDGDIGFLRTGSDSDSTATVLTFLNTNTIGAAPNLTEANFLAVANAAGVDGHDALTTFKQGSAFFVKDPNNLASSYTFTLDAQAITDNGGTATMSFDFNFLTNEGDWVNNAWTNSEGNNKWASDDTLFMVLVKYDANGVFVSQEITEITSVYDADGTYGYTLLGNGSYDFQTDTQTYTRNFNVSDAGSYQLYFVVLDASTANPADSTALAIDNLRVDGGLETVVDIREISGNVITGADVLTGNTDVPGADGIDRISKLQVGDDVFTATGNTWTLSTNGPTSDASLVSYDDTTKLLTLETDVGGTLEIYVDGANMGNYTYIAPINSGATTDAIQYTVMDNDGTESTATLTVNIAAAADFDSVVEGTSGNDAGLLGTSGDDLLIGGAGNDILNGGAGDDDDVLTGGLGADTFVWNTGDTGADTVTDFSVAENDVLNVADLLSGGIVMTAVASSGHLQLQFSDGGNVVQTIDLANMAVADNTAATNLMNQLLSNGNIVD